MFAFKLLVGGEEGEIGALELHVDDNDWHLLPSAASIFKMGLDSSSDICGASSDACTDQTYGTSSCGDAVTDRDGKRRPHVPAAGAYEP